MVQLPKLNFTENFDFKLQQEGSKVKIFDEIRRKYLLLTPEEWVRQTVVKHLLHSWIIPKSALLLEKKITLHQTTKRLDILVVKKENPFLLVECKAPEIPITEKTFEQIARYNFTVKAPYLLITNGMNHFLFHYEEENTRYTEIDFWSFTY